MSSSTKLTRALVDTAMGRVPANYTVVDGKFIVKEGKLVTVDERKLIEEHNKAAKRLLAS